VGARKPKRKSPIDSRAAEKEAVMWGTIPIHVAHLRNQLFSQLSLPMQRWVNQQADQIVRSGHFERWEETRLDQAIQRKLQQFSQRRPLRIQDVSAASSILEFLVTAGAYAACLDVRNKRQEAMTSFEGFDQKSNALFTILSTVVKTYSGTAMDIVRSMM
jgi:hypothetical protein